MRSIDIQLFGAFRDVEPTARVTLEVRGDRVHDARAALDAHAQAHWPPHACALVARSAFASETTILRDADPLPDGMLALLPPVSGG